MTREAAETDRTGPHSRDSNPSLLLTVREAASMLRISRSGLYVLIKNGDLATLHIGRASRLTRRSVELYVKSLEYNDSCDDT
jgi:excisionase family DNA binding protein